MPSERLRLLVTLGLGLFALTSCNGGGADSSAASVCTGTTSMPTSDVAPVIAFATNFCGYRTWESFPIPYQEAQGNVHPAGARMDYINRRPPKGSTEFPIGTIIVKEIEVGPVESRQVFAMVKRGAGFNSDGALNWEWFELQNDQDGNVSRVMWHGFGPPNGVEAYGGDPKVCNTCHGSAKANDYVHSMPLQLPAISAP